MVHFHTQKFALYSLPSGNSYQEDGDTDVLFKKKECHFGTGICDLDRIVEQMPAVLWATDLELNITFSAGNMRAQLNPGTHFYVGMPLSEFFGAAAAPSPALEAHYGALGGYAQSFEIRVGDTVFAGVAEPLFNSEWTLVGTVGVLVNIGRPREAEQERTRQLAQNFECEKRQGMMNLAKGIGQHFSNLFETVSVNAALIRAHLEAGHPIQKPLANIEEAARCAADLADQLRNTGPKTDKEREPLDLTQMLADHVQSFAAFVSPKIGLECDLAQDHPNIIGERDEIRRLLTNLLFNAAAAIGDEEGTICVRTQVADGPPWVLDPEERLEFPEGEYLWLQVSDTGEGLDEEARTRMFEPFAGFTGQNLGLATALRIVDHHHGVISVSSKPGLGSTYHVFLPIVPQGDPAEVLPPDSFF